MLQQFTEVFCEELETARAPSVQLKLKENSQPKFVSAHLVLFASKDTVVQEIYCLELVEILKKVEFSCWATPVPLPVTKTDGPFRTCRDFKVTLNPALEIDQHPIPKPEDNILRAWPEVNCSPRLICPKHNNCCCMKSRQSWSR